MKPSTIVVIVIVLLHLRLPVKCSTPTIGFFDNTTVLLQRSTFTAHNKSPNPCFNIYTLEALLKRLQFRGNKISFSLDGGQDEEKMLL